MAVRDGALKRTLRLLKRTLRLLLDTWSGRRIGRIRRFTGICGRVRDFTHRWRG